MKLSNASKTLALFVCFSLLGQSIGFTAAPAAPQVVDCKKVLQDRRDTQAEQTDVDQCIYRGADPIAAIRPNNGKSEGVKVGIANGFAFATVNPPENSPRAVHANASVSGSAITAGCKFPPSLSISSNFKISMKPGSCLDFVMGLFKDKNGQLGNAASNTTTINTSPAGTTPGDAASAASCAADSDTTGTYGAKVTVATGSNALVCGGAIPLSNYQLTLNPNPTSLASTENGAYYIWFYQKQGSGYTLLANNPLKLPTHLGDWDEATKTCNNQVDLGTPIAQMVTYNGAAQNIALRLVQKAPSTNNVANAQDASDALAYDPQNIEKFLVIPIQNGIPKVPGECAPAADYYKPISTAQSDMVIDVSASLACEAGADQCALATAAPSKPASCDLVNIFPSGQIQTSAGAVDCAGTTLYSILNRPTLIFKPGSTPVATSIEGRTAMLVATIEGSKIYAPTDTVFHIGANAPKFVLNDGGTLGMTDNSRLKMSGPATINPANASITLTNGGQLLGPTGGVVREIPPGTVYSPPNPILPLTLLVARSIDTPAGYQIPTQPSPYVRLPLDKPQ